MEMLLDIKQKLLSVWITLLMFLTCSVKVMTDDTLEPGEPFFLGNFTGKGEFYLYKGPKSWQDAKSKCSSDSGNLLIIDNNFMQEEIIKAMKDVPLDFIEVGDNWIGANRADKEKGWMWLGSLPDDTIQVAYQNYKCAYMSWVHGYHERYKANSMCDEPKQYICKTPDCSSGPSCYFISSNDDKLSYDRAEAACVQKKMLLATFMTLNEEGMGKRRKRNVRRWKRGVKKEELGEIEDGDYWIGLQYVVWQWVSGKYVTFAHEKLTISESNKNEEKECLRMTGSGHWIPTDCTEGHNFICQFNNGRGSALGRIFDINTKSGQTNIIIAVVIIIAVIFIVVCVVKCVQDKKEKYNEYRVAQESRNNYRDGNSSTKKKKCSIEDGDY